MKDKKELNLILHECGGLKIETENYISPFKNLTTKSFVVNTGTNDCSLKCGSLDQIAEFVDNATAKYGESFGSSKLFIAVDINSLYSEGLKNLTNSLISVCLISNSCSDRLDFNKLSSLYFSNSKLINFGAKNSELIEKNKYEAVDNGFNNENNILLSNTSFIFYLKYLINFSLFSGDTSFNNFSRSMVDNSDSNLLNESFFALLPKSTDHLINSCSSLELNLLINSCLFINSCLTSSDKFIQRNLEISCLNSLSTANVIDAIYISPLDLSSSSFFSSCIFLDITLLANSATFTSGNCSLNLFNNSSGIDIVILGILDSSSIYFNTSNYFRVYKLFGPEDLSNHEDSFNFLKQHLRLEYIIEWAGPRKEILEIPEEALREALINAFSYSDYSEYDSVNIAIFKDRVEIRSPGGLLT